MLATLAIMYGIYSASEAVKTSKQEINCTMDWKLEKIAHDNGVEIEKVADVQDMFIESESLGGAGGQGAVIVIADSPQQLVNMAKNRNSTFYNGGTCTIYYEYVQSGYRLEKKYFFLAPEGVFEWTDSQNIIFPESVCIWGEYSIKSSNNTDVPGQNLLIMEKTGNSLGFASILIIILVAILAAIIYGIWHFIDSYTYFWSIRRKTREYIEKIQHRGSS